MLQRDQASMALCPSKVNANFLFPLYLSLKYDFSLSSGFVHNVLKLRLTWSEGPQGFNKPKS